MAGYTVSSVVSGKYSRQVTVAASGPQGVPGPAGARGDDGTPGGLFARFKFLNSYSAANPGTGYLAFNNSAFMQATRIYISSSDSTTNPQDGLLEVMVASTNSNKAVITLQKVADARKYARFYVTAGVDNSGWWTLTISYIDGTALSWAYNENIDVLVAPIGDAGPAGPTGPQGARGDQGIGVPSGGTAGQILRKSASSDYATEWVDAETIQNVSMNELTDIDLSALADGYVLVYDEETSTWVPTAPEALPQSTGSLSGTIEGGSASSF